MLWSFRGLRTFSLYPSSISVVSLQENQSNSQHVPLGASSNVTSFKVINSLTKLKGGLATHPDLETGYHNTSSQLRLCYCEHQEAYFCPYCDCDRRVLVKASAVQVTRPSSDSELQSAQLPNTSARRKLRKFRSNYHQLRYEALAVESILAERPDSLVSSDLRTPLLNPFLSANLKYSPRPPVHRSRNKLEKKDKRSSSISLRGTSTSMLSTSTTQPVKIVTSRSFQKPKEVQGSRPNPIFSSIDTDVLVALAWTGETLSPLKPSEVGISNHSGSTSPLRRGSHTSSISNTDPPQSHLSIPPLNTTKRSVLRKPRDSDNPTASSTRPWTFAMAITDDTITDEKLVNDLEDMRIKDVVTDSIALDPYPLGLGPPPLSQIQLHDSYAEYTLQAGEASQEDVYPIDSSWNAARQVFLLCREFVRTERRYIASLRTLITSGTSTPPPASMLPYLPGLIAASHQLLERMEENPSVQGVSDAFLACENVLKQAFVDWCSVVGEFFDHGEKVKPKTEPEEPPLSSLGKLLRSPHSRPTQMRTDTALSVVIPEPNKIRKNTRSRSAVRDLAILPTQRIMRYVLLFKEFYSLTPTTSPSVMAVERALKAAQSIADAANEAQGHAAFEQPPIRAS